MMDPDALESLKAECMGCTRCPLAKTRRNVVFADGNPQAPLVVVGEGPGEQEDAQGLPFVGPAGRLLDQVLLENAITRRWVYICNTVKCRASAKEGGRVGNRPPSPAEMDACRPWLDRQLRLVRPVVILCLGAPAAGALIRKGLSMSQERGRWFTDSPYAPWVMASWHPAYVLRTGGGRSRAREELVADIAQCRRKVIEVRQQGGLLMRQAPLPEEVREPPPRLTLFGEGA